MHFLVYFRGKIVYNIYIIEKGAYIMDYINEVIADFMEIGYTEKEATALAWAKFVEAI